MKIKTKEKICEGVCFASMFFILGIAGNIERGITPIGRGFVDMLILLVISALSAYKAGWMS